MNVNEAIRDAMLLHAVYLSQVSTGEVVSLLAILEMVDKEIRVALRGSSDLSKMTTIELAALLNDIKQMNAEAQWEITKDLKESAIELSRVEAAFAKTTLEKYTGLALKPGDGPAGTFAKALGAPFDGVVVDDALQAIEISRMRAIEQAVRRAFIEGNTLDDLVRDLYGTKQNGHIGMMSNVSRRNVEAVARTVYSHVANQSRDAIYRANADVLKGVQWVATLDHRTCIECGVMDGQVFGVEARHPFPPRHYSCRCVMVPVVKPWEEFGIEDIPEGTRASMNGQVPESWTFSDWLARQSAPVQREVLGATRFQMYQSGTAMEQFLVDGRIMTLKELAAK